MSFLERRNRPDGNVSTARFAFILILLAVASQLQAQITLATPASPSSGQPGVTSVTLTGTGFPTGTILPANTYVKLEPSVSGAGPTVSAAATSVVTVVGSTRRVVFLLPAGVAVATSTPYLLSISGFSSSAVFQSNNKAAFTVNAAPALLSVNPAAGIVAQSLTVVLNAQLTSFVQGSTQASFGPGISVGGAAAGGMGPVVVVNPTLALAVLQVNAGAATGARDVAVATGTSQLTLPASFTVNATGTPPPSTAITLASPTSPDAALPGMTTVTVSATNFPSSPIIAGQINVLLQPATAGAGPTLTTVATAVTDVVNGARQVSFVFPASYAPSSPVAYLVSLYGSSSNYGALTTGFTFGSVNTSSVTIGQSASLTSATPNTGLQGATLDVVLTGLGTHFAQGQTKANFGAGISVAGTAAANFGTVTVASATSATAHIQVDSAAAAGVRTVQVSTGTESVALTGGFTVQTSGGTTPALTSITPSRGQQGQTVSVTLTGVNTFFGASTTVSAGAGISVGSVVAVSATSLTAQFTITANAALGARAITVTTGTQTVSLAGAFNVLAAAPMPLVTMVSPGSGMVGAVVPVTITGANTSFDSGSVVSFGTGITVAKVVALNATTITANLTITTGAALGATNVTVTTGSQVASLAGAFNVLAAAPMPLVTMVSPGSGMVGAVVPVTITGANTSFNSGSVVSFGTGITVANVVALNATTITANLTITTGAALGATNVTVTTGSQVASLAGAFNVLAAAPMPLVTMVSPGSGTVGAVVPVTITGANTSFDSGSAVSFGTGITVANVVALNATTITANLTITASAALGATNVTVTTGSQVASLAGGFTILSASAGTISSVSPALGVQGATVTVFVVGQGTSFAMGSTTADFGSSVTVNSVVVADATHATVQVVVAASAAAGPRDVKLTTHGSAAVLSGGFRVAAPGPQVTITSPASLTLFAASPITVTGTVSDPQARVAVNGVQATLSGTTFSASGVTLAEASNTLVATATNADGVTGSASISVVLDTTPPTIGIDSPSNGAVVTSTSVTVSGMVNDIVSGTVNAQQVTVTVNGLAANVSNRSFEIQNLLLVRGQNTVTAIATDRAGNQTKTTISVTVQSQAAQQSISMISGNAQTGVIGSQLPNPLVVQLLDSNSNPVSGRAVTFTVRRSDGMVLASGQTGQTATLTTDSKGFAQVLFQLGSHVGAGMNQVQVTSPGFMGETIFCATSTAGPAVALRSLAEITSVPVGVAGQTLSKPLVAIALDSGGNPVAGVPVVYTVTRGGGNLSGQTTSTVTTDSDGKASVLFTLGQQEGISNNVVAAALQSAPSETVSFQASGVIQGSAAGTTLSGFALDDSNNPIPNATVTIVNTSLSTLSDSQGHFVLSGLSPGFNILDVDGRTSTRTDHSFPYNTYPLEIIAGVDNSVGKPCYLPIIDTASAQVVGGNSDVVLTMAGVPGVAFTVFANSVTFADGSHVGKLSISQVHGDKIPHAPPNGSVPRVVWTMQPAGTLFSKPVRVQLPNTDNLAPGQVVEIFQIDHDLHQFVSVGMARVSADGSVLVTDPGFGITKAGWGVPAPPPPPKYCADGCKSDNPCVSGSCVNGACVFTPSNEGSKCGDSQNQCGSGVCRSGSCQVDVTAADGTSCTPDDKCAKMPGMCESGQCKSEKREFTTEVGASIEGSLAIPDTFKSKLKSLFAALGSGDVDVEDVKVAVEGTTKDCCSQEAGFIALGEQTASAGASLTVTLVDAPLYGVKLNVDVDFIVVSASLSVKVGLFWSTNLAFGGKISDKESMCDMKDSCIMAELALSTKLELRATFSVDACVETLLTAKSCDGVNVTPAALSTQVSVGFSYNKANCQQGAEGFVSFGKLQATGQIAITISNVQRKVSYAWDLLPGLTLYWP